MDDQLGQRFANAERTSVWMRQRIETLGRDAEAAAAASAAYKDAHRIALGPDGRTDDERELAELRRDLETAKAELAEARTRLAGSQRLHAAEGDGSSLPEPSLLASVDSPAIREIVRRYEEIAPLSAGAAAADPAGPQVAGSAGSTSEAAPADSSRTPSLASLRSRFWDEVRLAEAADRQAVESGTLRLASLTSRAATLNAKVEETRATVVELRRLEANHTRLSQLHDLLQNRYSRVSDFLQQQYLPVTESRIVTDAVPPLKKSSPKSTLLLFLGGVAGAMVGMGGALAKEYADHSITRPEQLEHELGVRWIGTLTRFRTGRDSPVSRAADLSSDRADRSDGDKAYSVRDPDIGRAADTLKGVKVALEESVSATGGGHLIAVASAEAGTGKTTVALGLAIVTAAAGHRTLLVDGNVLNPTLSLETAETRRPIPVPVADDDPFFERAVEHPLGFHVLPQRADDIGPDLLAMREVRHLLQRLRKSYDYVIVDTAAMLDHIDLAAAAAIFDALVVVVEHGRTVTDDLERALGRSAIIGERVAGAVINKAKPSARRART
ncbi:AAA family ATPase [Rhodoplanes roseus]|uniref:nucleotide-binding protein n=1 Tax=Rhodoplanes roseus TaxID=29409 RepID=UPI001FDFBD1B|nr:AAA family ATPase [Rhodoplanes roseus]